MQCERSFFRIVWNKELLYVGGFLARVVYELELANIRSLCDCAATDFSVWEDYPRSVRQALHAMKFFNFHASTPSPFVSSLLEAAFFASGPSSFPVISTRGVRSITDVRVPNACFKEFLKALPVLPDTIMEGAGPMVSALRKRGILRNITLEDVLLELSLRPLDESEMIVCLTWWVGRNNNLIQNQTTLLEVAKLTLKNRDGSNVVILPLSGVQKFVNIKAVDLPIGSPLPAHVLPLNVSKAFTADTLSGAFPWTEMSIIDWLCYISDPGIGDIDKAHDMTRSPLWAESVLNVLADAWPKISDTEKCRAMELLRPKNCVPTSHGMIMPDQSYLADHSLEIFPDLPIVSLSASGTSAGTLDEVLLRLGVRDHAPMPVILKRSVHEQRRRTLELS
jgi:Protein of unknown function (DUF3684)